MASAKISSGSGSLPSSSSCGCSWEIIDIVYGDGDDNMGFTIHNTGCAPLTITGYFGDVAAPGDFSPAAAYVIAPGGVQFVNVYSPGMDLRATYFTVTSDCGNKEEIFPVA